MPRWMNLVQTCSFRDSPKSDKEKYDLWREESGGSLLREPNGRDRWWWVGLAIFTFAVVVSVLTVLVYAAKGWW